MCTCCTSTHSFTAATYLPRPPNGRSLYPITLDQVAPMCCPCCFSKRQEAARVLRAVMRSATHPQQQPSGEAMCVDMVDVLVERAIEATNLPQVCHAHPASRDWARISLEFECCRRMSRSSSFHASLKFSASHHCFVLCVVVVQGGAPAVATRLSYRPFLTVLQVDPYPLWWPY